MKAFVKVIFVHVLNRQANVERLQHSEGVNAPFGVAFAWWYANLREDIDREDNHIRCGAI